jgi:signal transduction histidine kinase
MLAMLALLGACLTVYFGTRWRGSQRELEIAKQANEALAARLEAERAKGEVFALACHELRNPLGSLHNSLEILTQGIAGPLPERAQRMAEIALNSAGRLIRLTTQTLDYGLISNDHPSRDLSALHEGSIGIESPPSEGGTCHDTLPRIEKGAP